LAALSVQALRAYTTDVGERDEYKAGITRLFGIAALAAGLLIPGTASAWYGDPWYRPYGSGAMVYKRLNMMRGHG